MDKRVISRAARKLELRDVALHTSSLTRNKKVDPSLYPYSIDKDTTIQVKSEELSFTDESNENISILRSFINFELVGFPRGESPSQKLFTINTVYRVDYEIVKALTTEEIKEFSTFNTVHNAWPFWRQHIHYISNNAQIPRITIPLFRSTGTNKPVKKKKRRRAVSAKKRQDP